MRPVKKNETYEFPPFSAYLEEHHLQKRISFLVQKRVVVRQLEQAMQERQVSRTQLAEMIGTSRAQLNRVLDPVAQNVTIETLARVADALGRQLHISLA